MYITLISLSLFFSFLYQYTKDRYFCVFVKLFLFLLLTLPLIFRKGIGTDYINYINIYNTFKAGGDTNVDIGWKLLNYLVISLNSTAQWIFILSGFFTVIFFIKSIDKEAALILVISYLSFYYFPSYNIIRQILSISIVLYIITKKSSNTVYNILLYCIALSLHLSSIIFIVVFINTNKKAIQKIIISIIGLMIFLVFQFINPLALIQYVLGIFDNRYSAYLDMANYIGAVKTSGLGLFSELVFFFVLYNLYDQNTTSNRERNITNRLFLLAVLFYSMSWHITILARFKYSFYILLFLLIPKIRKNSLNNLIVYGFSVFFLIVCIIKIYSGENGIFPYNSIF